MSSRARLCPSPSSRRSSRSRVGWGYSVQKRCFFRHFFDFYKDFEKKIYLMVSYSWKVVTTHYLSYPSLFGGLKGPPFFYRSWVIRIAPHGASRITLGVLKKKGPLGSLIPKFWLKTMRTCKLTCYLWYGTRSETKKVISTEKLKSIDIIRPIFHWSTRTMVDNYWNLNRSKNEHS